MVDKAKQCLDHNSHEEAGAAAAVAAALKGPAKNRWPELKAALAKFADDYPGELPKGIGMADLGAEAPKIFLLSGDVYDNPQQEVQPGFLQILAPAPARISPAQKPASSGRRAALARILADPENPLTARVMVNRVWHYHFGQGLVRSPSDFGLKGERPTHPALLDWLTREFTQNGWSLKHLHRLIMASSTYQQSSRYRAEAAKIHPENKLLWRFPLQPLDRADI